jgi:4-hydroxy-tetrahydrodipicolinate synthase
MHAELPTRTFGSVLSAMVTPFSEDGSLDTAAAASLASYLVDSGNQGLVISGTTGESPTTSDAEKEALLRAVLEAVGDRARVLAGVGTNDTRHTVELAEQAAKAGAHGLLVVTPYYNRPPDAGLIAHFTTVADATDLPVMLYDIPGRTGKRLSRAVLQRVSEHERIVAVKDATADIAATMQVIASTGLEYYCGDDELVLPWLASGAVGHVGVATHLAPGLFAELAAAVDAGDLARARAVNARLSPVVDAVMNHTQGAIMAKAGLQLQGVLGTRITRLPLPSATEAEVELLRDSLATAGLLESAAVAR